MISKKNLFILILFNFLLLGINVKSDTMSPEEYKKAISKMISEEISGTKESPLASPVQKKDSKNTIEANNNSKTNSSPTATPKAKAIVNQPPKIKIPVKNIKEDYSKSKNILASDNTTQIKASLDINIPKKDTYTVFINDEEINSEKNNYPYPIRDEGRILFPLRLILDKTNLEAKWDEQFSKFTIKSQDKTIEMKLNEKFAKINNEIFYYDVRNDVIYDVYPKIINERIFVPVRFIIEQLNGTIEQSAHLIDGEVVHIIKINIEKYKENTEKNNKDQKISENNTENNKTGIFNWLFNLFGFISNKINLIFNF